jgi:long-chain acyl-CoA synthetase
VDELMAWLATRLARTSWPVGITFVDELPRNALGKVLKRELREPFWAGRERDVA